MRQPAIIGVDLGTSELKAGLIDPSGRLLGLERAAYPTHVDATGRAEQDPEDWWNALGSCVRALAADDVDIAAICVVGQGPTLVAVDSGGRPVRPAITWQDRRSDRFGTGYGLLPKLAWLAADDPRTVAEARWLLSAWDALALRLSGRSAVSCQRHELPLGEADLRGVGIDPDRIPGGRPIGTVLGPLTASAADSLGLSPSVRVVTGVNDGTASILGAGLLEAGDAVDTGGASGGIAILSDSPRDPDTLPPGTFSAAAPVDDRWVLGGAMAGTGSALTWLAEAVLGGKWTIDELLVEAAQTAPGADGLVFLPYLAGERAPIWDDAARGMFFGLTLAHGRGHLVRAVLEAAGLAVRHVAGPIVDSGVPVRELRLAGWLARDERWAQVRADVTGFTVGIPRVEEVAVLGAGILAATGTGLAGNLRAAVQAMTAVTTRLGPRPEHRATYDRAFEVYRALYPATRGLL